MPRLLALAALSLVLSACAGPASAPVAPVGEPLRIEPPPSGALTDAQLARVRADVGRLLAAPLAPDAADAQRALIGWLAGSPDVSVTLCADTIGPLLGRRSTPDGEPGYTILYTLASAAAVLDAPALADDPAGVAAVAAGLLADSYATARAQGAPAVAFLDGLVNEKADGTLDARVRRDAADCG